MQGEGWVKLQRSLRTKGHLQSMPDAALRLYVIFQLAAEWRDDQALPRGCLEMSYKVLRRETGYGRSKIAYGLKWLLDPPPPSEGPYIKKLSSDGQTLRIQVVNLDTDQSYIGTTSGDQSQYGTASQATSPNMGPHTGETSPNMGPVDDGRDGTSPKFARPRSQIRATPPTRDQEDQDNGDPDPNDRDPPGSTPPVVPPKSPAAAANGQVLPWWPHVLAQLAAVMPDSTYRELEACRPVALANHVLVLEAPADPAVLAKRWGLHIGTVLREYTDGLVTRCEIRAGGSRDDRT